MKVTVAGLFSGRLSHLLLYISRSAQPLPLLPPEHVDSRNIMMSLAADAMSGSDAAFLAGRLGLRRFSTNRGSPTAENAL